VRRQRSGGLTYRRLSVGTAQLPASARQRTIDARLCARKIPPNLCDTVQSAAIVPLAAPAAASIASLNSTTKGFVPPHMIPAVIPAVILALVGASALFGA